MTSPRRRLRLLDLFCGGGGASAGYHAAGFDVIGVDIVPQPDYPFPFVLGDALNVDLAGFDVVAASPPCQRYSSATPVDRRDLHPDLVEPIRDRLCSAVSDGAIRAYVIENVPGAPLHDPVTVCGDSLRLGVRRHRLFESNLPLAGTPCWHDRSSAPVRVYGSYGQRAQREVPAPPTDAARAAMGADWMPWPALTQAIPPAFTYWLGSQLLAQLVTSPAVFRHIVDGQSSPAPELASVTSAGAFRQCRCGLPLPPRPETGRWPRYCSHACRQAAYRARQLTPPDARR